MLKVHGRIKTECAVESHSIIEDLNVGEDRALGFGARGVHLPVAQFGFIVAQKLSILALS